MTTEIANALARSEAERVVRILEMLDIDAEIEEVWSASDDGIAVLQARIHIGIVTSDTLEGLS